MLAEALVYLTLVGWRQYTHNLHFIQSDMTPHMLHDMGGRQHHKSTKCVFSNFNMCKGILGSWAMVRIRYKKGQQQNMLSAPAKNA